MKEEYREPCAQLERALETIVREGGLEEGAVIVLGCSTSEVAGGVIGHNSVPELGEALAETMIAACRALGVHPVFQCCEHLNRALILEKPLLKQLGLLQVNVMPVPKAGGSAAAGAWNLMEQPAAAAFIQADAAIDIGDTLVGMHIRPVAVPLRMPDGQDRVGGAHLVMAYSRLPNIGGERAKYPPKTRQ